MITRGADTLSLLATEVRAILKDLGKGRTDGVAYDTAWVARLARSYASPVFSDALTWLRQNQYDDGTWGAPLVQYHDRFISTLAAIVTLREGGRDPRDARRVQRGEDALWRVVGRLGMDDSDTVGFPVLSVALADEALALGLDVPRPPIRFAEPYRRKVKALLANPDRDWRASPLIHSLEALRSAVPATQEPFGGNYSVGVSPSATAGYLLERRHDLALNYLTTTLASEGTGAAPALMPIDVFDIAWSLIHLRHASVVDPDDPDVRRGLDFLWQNWSPECGIGCSSYFTVPDVDDTAAAFIVLRWGGYPVSPDVFAHYEMDDNFSCYHGETNVSLSAHARLLAALRLCEDHPRYPFWIEKTINVLRRFDENGSFWWDKWHASPYYVNSAALNALHGVADDLASTRLKWILRTQNDDGGWGYLGRST
ncbi:MAG: hypothetical protein IT323_04010, partial [Anaerolineae bacterium]|nr:hypothetical protein [Anaerolineae bacterium]